MNKAIFLDRDGVLNKLSAPHDYVKTFDEFIWNPYAQELIKEINSLGFLAIVISNQQGIGKGVMSAEFVAQLHKKMNEDLQKTEAHIDAFYICPHLISDVCDCRKPKPTLFFTAAKDFDISLADSFFIGDSETDAEAAATAGCTMIMIESDKISLEKIRSKTLTL